MVRKKMGMDRYSPAWDYGYDNMGLSEMGLVEWLNGYVEVSTSLVLWVVMGDAIN